VDCQYQKSSAGDELILPDNPKQNLAEEKAAF
jgi:hypothetical protein